ncbi:MAG: polyprenyl diphosphate synthase [Bdellovibrionota bacterium]
MPRHVAIIMDGNARWAERRGLPIMEGHREGAKTLVYVAKDARRLGVRYLTVFAFSTENWKRPKAEIEGLWLLLKEFSHKTYGALRDEGIELRTIGDTERLPKDLQSLLASCVQNKPEKVSLTLTLALSYGGRDEIVRAVRKLAREGKDLKNLTEEDLSAALDTAGRKSSPFPVVNFLRGQFFPV